MNRRSLFGFACLAIVTGATATPLQAQVGGQPIRIVFPFAAGGSGDALARLIAEKMQADLNRNVIVESRTGGAGRIGVLAVKNASPDGSTLLITPIAPVAVYPHTYKTLDYDPIKDFAAVSQVATFDFGIAVNPQLGVT
jgi:tripartite-type tricarboxylate transporter receptor subunit TctC